MTWGELWHCITDGCNEFALGEHCIDCIDRQRSRPQHWPHPQPTETNPTEKELER